MKPNKPGDNWMLFDEWTVTAHGDDQPTNSYGEWLETYFKDLHMDPLADADDDGLNNLFEF